MMYTLEQIREAINAVIKDDGLRADEVVSILESWDHDVLIDIQMENLRTNHAI